MDFIEIEVIKKDDQDGDRLNALVKFEENFEDNALIKPEILSATLEDWLHLDNSFSDALQDSPFNEGQYILPHDLSQVSSIYLKVY